MSTPTFQLAVNGQALTLIEFDGVEAMNRIFEYVFVCEIPAPPAKLSDCINSDAIFTVCEYDTDFYTGDLDIPGYISKASKKNGTWILEFHPKIKKVASNCRSEIYFDNDAALTAKTVIDSEFSQDITIEDRSFVNSISDTLPGRKLICQYNESNFNFVSRLCDYWGIQFYFDHNADNIVFSDFDAFEPFEGDGFTDSLKTTLDDSDNNKYAIRDWREDVKAPERYITVIGHDHENAGTDIVSSYPTGDNSGLTESRLNISGVQSQEEADYLAQIRYEAENCKNQLASGVCSIPYLYPGFVVETDDSDFASAVVIKTTHRARNLNSVTAVAAASYECDIEMIPENSKFRPDLHYPQPQASTVLGQTISDSVDSSLAQRNESGEYKVKFMGFESNADITSEPWIRKAQTTGGSNSVDIPLTPNTEVLLAFVDNNPNCPYIQHAMDNSLHPIPVNNVNAHHAVISTDGMLVTSSLQGRYNLSTTRSEERVPDSSISGTVKNYFTNRGDFDQNANFIDPSGTHSEFTPEDRASGNYLIKQFYGDQVQINQGDRLHWHNGNLYDFGGYWNYNLGNSYEENFIDQEAPLNIKVDKDSRSGDILNSTGPAFTSVDFSAVTGGKLKDEDVTPASYGDDDIDTDNGSKTFKVNTDGEWGAGGLNVSKSYNASYDYKFGDEIDVSDRVNSLSVKHTDGETEAIEVVFHKGNIRSWEKVVGRNSEEKKWAGNGNKVFEGSSKYDSSTDTKTVKEKKWDILGNEKVSDSTTTEKADSIVTDVKSYNFNTGALAAHNIKKTDGMGEAEMDFSYSEIAKSAFNFGGTTSFSLSASRDVGLAISLSGSAKMSVEASLALDVKMGLGLTIEIDKMAAGKIEWNQGEFVYSGATIAAKVAPAFSATKKVTDLEKAEIKLNSSIMELANIALDLDQANVKLDTSYLVVYS